MQSEIDALRYGRDPKDCISVSGVTIMITSMVANRQIYIVGLAGEDLLRGGTGNDVLQAGGGDDKLLGNSGDDNIQGGPGLDQLNGDSGNDILFGGFDDDFLSAGNGDDDSMVAMEMMCCKVDQERTTLIVGVDLI